MANINVLIVDDSLVFRSQIKAALTNVPGITVVGSASNGKIALEKLSTLKVDLMTLDLEMAEMNGLETLAELKKRGLKTKVIIFSSRTQSGADAAIVALQAGAADVVAKPTGENPSFEAAFLHIQSELVPKVKQFLPTENAVSSQTESVQSEKSKTESINLSLTEKKKPIGY
ncbi:MAG: response regulator, partial [Deltaproteobacteria bacterium]